MQLKISVIIEPDDGAFHAYTPAFPGLHVDGASIEEAFENASNAVDVYLKSLEHHGDPIPVGPDCVLTGNRPEIHKYKAPKGSSLQSLVVAC